MKDGFMVLPTDISAKVDALKEKIGNALDNLESFYKKEVKGKTQENVQKMVESIERAGIKRLTLTPHFEPEEMMVLEAFEKSLQEGIQLFEEEIKAEEEKKQQEEERKHIKAEEKEAAEKQRSEEENAEGSDRMMIDTSDQVVLDSSKDKGKEKMEPESPSYVLKMQEDIE
ncbi:hypothetical protein A2U01_0025178, partial [Trifolium medium]|nr:hypothetical protein [Trifolium medium]